VTHPAGTDELHISNLGTSTLRFEHDIKNGHSFGYHQTRTDVVRWLGRSAAIANETNDLSASDGTKSHYQCSWSPPQLLESFPMKVEDVKQRSKTESGCTDSIEVNVTGQERIVVGDRAFHTWHIDVKRTSGTTVSRSTRWFVPNLGVDAKEVDFVGSNQLVTTLQSTPIS